MASEALKAGPSLEVLEPNLGVFRAKPVSNPLPGGIQEYCFSASLDFYQSNCLRQWLDMRWQSAALESSTVFLPKKNEMVIEKFVLLSADKPVKQELDLWVKTIARDFSLYMSSRK
jgi:hypothetical protein